ncbi:MAG: hypothetical protein IJR31_08690 [Lachnospiraceae bacterium]|nr:hypothetical protein [Lachnospiraceae bacterium]
MSEIEYLPKSVHEEFAKRMEDENHRQNKRIEECEQRIRAVGEIVRSLDRLTVSVEQMAVEVQKQGERLERIEAEPADNWKKATWEIIKYVIVLVLGVVAVKIGISV